MKISKFLKTLFFSIIFTFTDDLTLNSDNSNKKMKFWTLLAFVCWPSLLFEALSIFFQQKLAFSDKN